MLHAGEKTRRLARCRTRPFDSAFLSVTRLAAFWNEIWNFVCFLKEKWGDFFSSRGDFLLSGFVF
jgi:hypothetical protein